MGRPAESAAEVHAQVESAEACLAEAEARLRFLTVRRRDALVAGSTGDVLAAEDETRKVQVDLERAELRLEGLGERLRDAEAAERRAERRERPRLIREKLELDEGIDGDLAALAGKAARRRQMDATIRRRWLGHAADFGPYAAEFLHDHLALRGAVPVDLARELGVREGLG